MEDNIQAIVGAIISVFLLFIFPVYMAYEKKDDIAYALTMRYTQEFVDSVKAKGYITSDMLENYKKSLLATGNSFDIELTHEYTRMDPITNYYSYDDKTGVYTLELTKTQEQRIKDEEQYIKIFSANNDNEPFIREEEIRKWYEFNGYDKVEDTYRYTKETYYTDHIESILRTEKKLWPNATTDRFICVDVAGESTIQQVTDCVYAYTMNEGDTFNVTVKNTNTTAATVIYNMVTINTVDENTRIYVNYGGEILNTQWYGKLDYNQMKDEVLDVYNFEEYALGDVLEGSTISVNRSPKDYKGYLFEFEAKPYTTTDLRTEGYELKSNEYEDLYNPVAGDSSKFAISIGINGISMIYDGKVILSHAMTINQYTHIKMYMKKVGGGYKAILYIDNDRVAESIVVSSIPVVNKIGAGLDTTKTFQGHIRNTKIHI